MQNSPEPAKRIRDHELYNTWKGMMERCSSEGAVAYRYYGAKGVRVCERWHSFWNFVEDMGMKPTPLHTIDRWPNKSGNYGPGNCRWATMAEQNHNKENNHWIEYEGERLTIDQWARKLGVKSCTICSRIKRGWSLEEIVTLGKQVSSLRKLSPEKAEKIRADKRPDSFLALAYGVSRRAIWAVRKGKSYT